MLLPQGLLKHLKEHMRQLCSRKSRQIINDEEGNSLLSPMDALVNLFQMSHLDMGPAVLLNAQAAGGRPTQDDGDRDNGHPGIGRRGYKFVDRVNDSEIVKGGLPITVHGVGKGFAKLGEYIRGI
jgi:hypothetical protein